MINFDKAAQAPILPEVKQAIIEAMDEGYGNPSALYSIGVKAKKKLEECREIIAGTINASPDEIVFTSGATEVNNWIYRYYPITSNIEHHSLMLGNNLIKPDKKYRINGECLSSIQKSDFNNHIKMIALGYINSEIGTIIDLEDINAYMIKDMIISTLNGEKDPRLDVLLYLDATQAYGHIPINVDDNYGIDFMCVSAQKFGGLAGAGFLYKNKDLHWDNDHEIIRYGGHQEYGFRAGTENLIGIIAMTKAAEIAHENMKEKRRKVSEIRNHLYGRITNEIPCAHLNGTADWRYRYEGNLNFRFDGYKGEELQSFMNDFDVLVSTGSACASGSGQPSHVLKAIGLTDEEANSSLRFTFDSYNSVKESDVVVEVLKKGLEMLKR